MPGETASLVGYGAAVAHRRAPANGVTMTEDDARTGAPDDRAGQRREWLGWAPSLAVPLLLLGLVAGGTWYFVRPTGDPAATWLDGTAAPATGTGAPAVGQAAPDFALPTLTGGRAALADYAGRPVIVNFWATWCGPCRQEMPLLARTLAAHAGEGLAILGVDIRESPTEVRPFVEGFAPGFPILLDSDGRTLRRYRVGGPPTSFLIGRDGRVLAVVAGPLTEAKLAELLPGLLRAPARP